MRKDGYEPCYALSADGKIFASPADNWGQGPGGIRLSDTISGEVIAHLKGQRIITALAFSPDNRFLASGSRDTTVLLWDLSRVHLLGLWEKLAAKNEETRAAFKKLVGNADKAVPFLKQRLKQMAAQEARIAALVADLEDDSFQVRQKATRELESLGPQIKSALVLALEGKLSTEAASRIRGILTKIGESKNDSAFWNARSAVLAVRILEEIGSGEARQSLQEVVKEHRGTRLASEAAAALRRLERRARSGRETKP